MKTLFLLLFFPVLTFGQTNREAGRETDQSTSSSSKAQPIIIRNGNAVNALYKVVCDTAKDDGYFDIIIYTHSYRDALKPSDNAALFIVDGLGKVFNILHWTSRYQADRVVSSIAIRMNKEEFKSIGYAGTVGVKIGANSFSIPHMARHNMRQIIGQLESLSGNEAGFQNTKMDIKVFYRDNEGESLVLN